jgi:hypothetical protein
MVFTSPSMKGGHFLDDHRLELTLGGDLVWLDADRPEDGLHFVAENAFGYPIDLGGNTALTGYDYNPPDDTGKLGLVDRSTGAKRLVSAAVSQYSIRIDGLDDGAVWPLAYLVRGRHPSAQDGIWLASIPVGDLR